MNWFPCGGTAWGFPWLMLVFPVLCFGMMLYFCSFRKHHGFAGCRGRRQEADLTVELSALRKELDELKQKIR